MKAYVIRLNGIETSETLAKDCINSGKEFGLHIEKFDGIYGEEQIENKSKDLDIRSFHFKFKKGRLGVKGCFLSHYILWLQALKTNTPHLIFEHDAIVLEKIPLNITHLFDEFLLLDPFNKFGSSYSEEHTNAKLNELNIIPFSNPLSKRKYGITDEYPMGLQAYIIKPTAAEKLVAAVKKNGYRPADIQCNKGIVNLETVSKPLASINKKFYNNLSLMKKLSSTQQKWD